MLKDTTSARYSSSNNFDSKTLRTIPASKLIIKTVSKYNIQPGNMTFSYISNSRCCTGNTVKRQHNAILRTRSILNQHSPLFLIGISKDRCNCLCSDMQTAKNIQEMWDVYVICTINTEIRKTETANQCVDVDGWVTGRRKNTQICTRACAHTHTHKHTNPFYIFFFLGLPGWAGARRNLLLDFIVQGEITEADTLTIQMVATSSRLTSDPPPSSPIFTLDALPIYPGLGQAQNMLACIPSSLVRKAIRTCCTISKVYFWDTQCNLDKL